MPSRHSPFVACLAVCLAYSLPALAGGEDAKSSGNIGNSANLPESALDTGVWTSPDGATVTYEASFFEPYQTVTAADMLRWVPGGAALLPDNRRGGNQSEKRGFGSGGDQILINGKRLSGKSNDIGSAMQRIQASASRGAVPNKTSMNGTWMNST